MLLLGLVVVSDVSIVTVVLAAVSDISDNSVVIFVVVV